MRKIILSLSVLALIACKETAVTDVASANSTALAVSEDGGGGGSIGYSGGTVPPPPNDSGTFAGAADYQQRFETTYFLNVPGNSGWLTFQKTQASNVTVDKNARISYSKGAFSGTGNISWVPSTGGRVTLYLSSVSQSSTFRDSKNGWFNLSLGRSTFTSATGAVTELGAATMSLNPKTRSECSIALDRACEAAPAGK